MKFSAPRHALYTRSIVNWIQLTVNTNSDNLQFLLKMYKVIEVNKVYNINLFRKPTVPYRVCDRVRLISGLWQASCLIGQVVSLSRSGEAETAWVGVRRTSHGQVGAAPPSTRRPPVYPDRHLRRRPAASLLHGRVTKDIRTHASPSIVS